MSGQAFRILLVEDNPADVYLFRKALTSAQLNFELTVIEDGSEAIAFAREEGEYAGAAVPIPDLAVLDLNLPKNEGSQVLEAIRRNNRFSDVPVVIASSSSSPRERARTEELGVDLFLTKPADLEGFLQMGTLLKDLLVKRGEGRPAANAAP